MFKMMPNKMDGWPAGQPTRWVQLMIQIYMILTWTKLAKQNKKVFFDIVIIIVIFIFFVIIITAATSTNVYYFTFITVE